MKTNLSLPQSTASRMLPGPQHSTEPFRLRPQDLDPKILTVAYVPSGGFQLSFSSPQHTTGPSAFTPQFLNLPALSAMNLPAGGVISP